MKQVIHTANAPSSPYFSQAIRIDRMVYLSGIVGSDPKTNRLAGQTIQEQTRQSLANCESILKAGGASLRDVVEVHILLARPGDFAGLNEEYVRFFPTDPPARTVSRLGPDLPNLLVSIKMTAVLDA